jgi:hypothetical protein
MTDQDSEQLPPLSTGEQIELAKRVCSYLNELLAADPRAVRSLVENRVPCNEALAAHPTCQVHADGFVGLLGLLNGLCGKQADGWGYIVAFLDEDGEGRIERFRVVLRQPEPLKYFSGYRDVTAEALAEDDRMR